MQVLHEIGLSQNIIHGTDIIKTNTMYLNGMESYCIIGRITSSVALYAFYDLEKQQHKFKG